MAQGRFLLFFTEQCNSKHEFIWSSDQEIKNIKPNVCLRHGYSQEKLKENTGHSET